MADIMKLGLGLDPGPMREGGRQVQAELDKVTAAAGRAANAVDDVSDAGSLSPRSGGGGRQGMGAVVRGAREAKVGVEGFGGAAEIAGQKFNTLLKASVGFAAFDLGAKVLGFGSAMDVLNKATDAAAKSLRDLLGIEDWQERLRREREAVEANAAAWDKLREARIAAEQSARGPGYEVPAIQLGAGQIGLSPRFISTSGLSSSQVAQVGSRFEGLRDIAAGLYAEFNTFRASNLDPATGQARRSDDPLIAGEAAALQFRLNAAAAEVERFALSLQELNARTKLQGEVAQALSDANRKSADETRRVADDTARWMQQADLMLQRARTGDFMTLRPAASNTPPFLAGANSREYFEALQGGGLNNPQFNTPGYRSPDPSSFSQEYRNNLERAEEEQRKLIEAGQRAQQVYRDLGNIGADAFASFLTGARSASDAVKALGADIYLYLVQGLITRPIGNALANSLQNAFPSFGANFAQHGSTIYQPSMVMPLGGGRPTLIAEGGPERIEPAYARGSSRGSGGGGRAVTIVVQPREGDNSWRRSFRQVLHDVKRGGL
jgi:hypothetical protein